MVEIITTVAALSGSGSAAVVLGVRLRARRRVAGDQADDVAYFAELSGPRSHAYTGQRGAHRPRVRIRGRGAHRAPDPAEVDVFELISGKVPQP